MKKLTAIFDYLWLASPLVSHAAISIDKLQARLYYDTTGTLWKPITEDMQLFNTIIGEGDGGGKSKSTLVDVVLKNLVLEFRQAKVQVTVTNLENKKVILNKTYPMTEHTFYLPSRLNNTGCDALLVTVNILGTKPVKKLKIPFMCGE